MNYKNRYSPKEALAIMIKANKKVSFKEFNNLVVAVEEILSSNINKSEILDNIDTNLLLKIKNYWGLTKEQIIAYAYVVFNHFKISREDINDESITEDFIYQMSFYSTHNVLEFVKEHFGVNLE